MELVGETLASTNSVGFSVEVTLGFKVGATVSLSVGLAVVAGTVGLELGRKVGLEVVGDVVGSTNFVGFSVRVTLGFKVGAPVSLSVGLAVAPGAVGPGLCRKVGLEVAGDVVGSTNSVGFSVEVTLGFKVGASVPVLSVGLAVAPGTAGPGLCRKVGLEVAGDMVGSTNSVGLSVKVTLGFKVGATPVSLPVGLAVDPGTVGPGLCRKVGLEVAGDVVGSTNSVGFSLEVTLGFKVGASVPVLSVGLAVAPGTVGPGLC
jgi:hypothetical protein